MNIFNDLGNTFIIFYLIRSSHFWLEVSGKTLYRWNFLVMIVSEKNHVSITFQSGEMSKNVVKITQFRNLAKIHTDPEILSGQRCQRKLGISVISQLKLRKNMFTIFSYMLIFKGKY